MSTTKLEQQNLEQAERNVKKAKKRMVETQALIQKLLTALDEAQAANAAAATEYRTAHEYLVDLQNAVNE